MLVVHRLLKFNGVVIPYVLVCIYYSESSNDFNYPEIDRSVIQVPFLIRRSKLQPNVVQSAGVLIR